ncbi:MAG: T9SS type A sorting domain-containing protein [Bacteroidia bacterium]|nr:T9SS type A sorting domain-containing protein [Bacteroidia bacterium]
MKSLFLFVLTCFMVPLAWGQIPAPTFRWAVPISGALQLYDMEVTPAGDVYVFGYFKDYICFDTDWDHCQYSHGKEDYFLAKYNQKGELVWGKCIGGRQLDGVQESRMSMDEKENLYLTLNIQDSIWINNVPISARNGSNAVCKIDKNGGIIWFERWRYNEGNVQFAVPFQNKLYLLGEQLTDMPLFNTLIPYQGSGNFQEYLCVIDPNKGIIDFTAFQEAGGGSNVFESFTHFLPLSNGNLLVAGRFETSLSVPPLLFEENNFPGGASYMLLLDPNLQPIWGEVYNSNKVAQIRVDESQIYSYINLVGNDTIKVFKDTLFTLTNVNENIIYKTDSKLKRKMAKRNTKSSNSSLFLGRRYFFTNTSKGAGEIGDTLLFYDNPIIAQDSLYSYYMVKADTNIRLAWAKHTFSFTPNQLLDRSVGIYGVDSSGYLYGQGRMNQFSIYLDSILVKPLFVTMGTYGEQFICSTTRDSFPPAPEPPPPPVDTLPPSGTVYPNPFNSVVNLVGDFETGNIAFEVIDTKGSLVWNQSLEIPQGRQLFTFDLSRLAGGIYFLRVKQNNKQSFYKLIKTS